MKYRALWGAILVPSLVLVAVASPLAGCGSSGSGPAKDAGAPADGNADSTVGDASDGAANEATTDSASDASSSDATTDSASEAEAGNEEAGPDGSADAALDQDAGEGGTPVSFTIDLARGPTRQHKPPAAPARVSPYIYGINASGQSGATGAFTRRNTRWGLVRKGSNAFTAWNWTNNYYNLGNTYCFWQGAAPGGTDLAATITQDVDSIGAAQAEGAAYLATVPIVDHVAATQTNETLADGGTLCPYPASACDGGPGGPTTNVNSNSLDFAASDPASPAFVPNAPRKPGAYCTCGPGQACDAGCVVSTNPVYQDEFVNFVRQGYAGDGGAAPVFFDLDNEPNYWGYTHPEVWPATAPPPCGQSLVTYDDVVNHDVPFAQAIKAAWPSALVFGPVASQDGMVYAHSYDTDPHFPTEFLDYYLASMAAAGADGGAPLLDVLDVHYYNSFIGSGPPSQCLQHPRMFWDPQFTALSPADTDTADFGYGGKGANSDYFDTHWYPRQLIPRLLGKIDAAYGASTPAPQLSFSEYNSGCETDIAGGLAEADDLGVFGREGVFAAAAMTFAPASTSYIVAAFDLYRNYDGNGAVVGDTAVAATTASVDTTSVYAFAHSDDPAALDLVVINKSPTNVVATLSVASASSFTTVRGFRLSAGAVGLSPLPSNITSGVSCANGTCTLTYAMPALTATTLVVR